MRAGDLVAGQKFHHDGRVLIATGEVDRFGDAVALYEDEGLFELYELDADTTVGLAKGSGGDEDTPTPYSDRQAAWVEEHDLKVGDKVVVTRKATSEEGGWRAEWLDKMDAFVGKTYTVHHIGRGGIILDVGGLFYSLPYTALQLAGEEPYSDRQAAWVKKHGLKVGDFVTVTRVAKDHENGWPVYWAPMMDDLVGGRHEIHGFGCAGVHIESEDAFSGYWNVPYFVLEVAADDTAESGLRKMDDNEVIRKGDRGYWPQSTRPWEDVRLGVGMTVGDYKEMFEQVAGVYRPEESADGEPVIRAYNAEEAGAIVGKVLAHKARPDGVGVVTANDPFQGCLFVGPVPMSYEEVLDEFTHLDGSPCGVAE